MPLNSAYTKDWPDKLPYGKQSVPVPGTKRPGQTAHYQNGIWGLITEDTPNILRTCDELFTLGLSEGADRQFLGHRPQISSNPPTFAKEYVWQTYGEVDVKRRQLGSALDSMFTSGFLGGGDYRTVGIWSQNRPEWQIVDITLQSYNMVSVSLYDTLGKDAVEYIVRHADITVAFATSDHIPDLMRLAPKLPMLKLIVSMDDLTDEAKKILTAWSSTQNVQVKDMKEMCAIGKERPREPIKAKPNDVSSISYTSGTTGNPKGAVILHKNFASALQSNLWGVDLPDDGCMISYLPLAHIYGRACEFSAMALSGKIGYFTGDPLRLLEDMQILKPEMFPAVPRVLNRIYQAAMAAGNVSGLRGALFRKAVDTKIQKFRTTGDNKHAFWDKLVFRKIQAVLGGKILLITTGSAPTAKDVLEFMKIAFSCSIFEGYGMTENCATCTKTWNGDPSATGTIGAVHPVNELKLVDVPSMNYTAEDKPNPRGEICLRGMNCFKEYYKDEKNTKSTIDDEGWLHTGDVGEIDSVGRFKIIDRVKNIMKLAQGEYVALEKIENAYSSSAIVAQLYVHGDPLQSFLLGVVVPDPVQLSAIASETTGGKIAPEDVVGLSKVCSDGRVVKRVQAMLAREAKKNGLKGFEMIKRIHLSMNPFSVEDNTMTPTMKIRRKDAYEKFKAELEDLYRLGEPLSESKL